MPEALTELEGTPQVGDFVKIEALLQQDGSLIAREVDKEEVEAGEDARERSKVKIEGTIERINPDGTLVVNGITVRDPGTATTPGDAIKTITIREGK